MIAIVNHAVVPVSSWIIIEGSNWTVLDQNKKKKINNTTILIRIRMTKSSCSIKINSANQFPFFSFLFSYSAIIPAPWTTYLQRENRIYKWHTETEPDEFSWNLTKGFWIFFGHIKCDVQSAYQSIITPRARTDAYTHTHICTQTLVVRTDKPGGYDRVKTRSARPTWACEIEETAPMIIISIIIRVFFPSSRIVSNGFSQV